MTTDLLLAEIADGQGEAIKRLARLVPSYRRRRRRPGESMLPDDEHRRPASYGRLIRWLLRGVRRNPHDPYSERVFLEAVRTPGGWVSTPAALGRFFAALTPEPTDETLGPRPTSTSRRAAERAGKELARIGI